MSKEQALDKIVHLLAAIDVTSRDGEPVSWRAVSKALDEVWTEIEDNLAPQLDIAEPYKLVRHLKDLFHSDVSLEDLQQRVRFRYSGTEEALRQQRAKQMAIANLKRYSRAASLEA